MTVVGVSADLDEPTRSYRGDTFVFVPWAQRYEPGVPVVLTARAVAGRAPSASCGRRSAASIRSWRRARSAPAGRCCRDRVFILRVISGLAAALGVIAMVLAMAGLFGVLSHVVLRRTREMGIRIALGADRGRGSSVSSCSTAFVRSRRASSSAWSSASARGSPSGRGSSPTSAHSSRSCFALVPIPFIVAALVACYVPAARASRVDPNVALRDL